MPNRELPYLDKNRTIYFNGQKVEPVNYTQPYVTLIDNGYICTCGTMLKTISGVYSHRKTINHLEKTKQICNTRPGTLKQQRDLLVNSKTRLW